MTDGGGGGTKWFVRSVSAALTQRVTQAARIQGRTIGSVVAEALTLWLDRQAGGMTDAVPDGWRSAVERRLSALEAAAWPGPDVVLPAGAGDRQAPAKTGTQAPRHPTMWWRGRRRSRPGWQSMANRCVLLLMPWVSLPARRGGRLVRCQSRRRGRHRPGGAWVLPGRCSRG